MARYGNCKCRICTGPEMMRDDLDAPYVLATGDCDAVASPDDQNALALARAVLREINDWATLDPEGERYPWVASRTAEALAALVGEGGAA